MLEEMIQPDYGNVSALGYKIDWRATEDVNLAGFGNT